MVIFRAASEGSSRASIHTSSEQLTGAAILIWKRIVGEKLSGKVGVMLLKARRWYSFHHTLLLARSLV